LVHKDWNQGGYARGQFEVLARIQHQLLPYDYVVHLHPDIYIASEKHLMDLITLEKESYSACFVSRVFGNDDPSFATDAFLFCPKRMPSGFFNKYLDYDTSIKTPLERVFFSMIKDYGLPHAEIRRFISGKYHRDVDEFGLWHEHYSIGRAKAYLISPILRYLFTIYFCSFRNPRLAIGVCRDFFHRLYAKQVQDPLLKQLSVA
jgi:hypothetical protein